MKTIEKMNVISITFALVIGCGLSYAMRSFNMFFAAAIFIFGIHVALACLSSVVAVWKNEQPAGTFTTTQYVVALTALLFIGMGLVSLVERLVWFNSSTVPAMFIAKDYNERYTANKHRIFKLACEVRHAGMFVREVDGRVFARCGDWYPDTYTVSATKAAWERAVADTKGDKPGAAVLVEADE
jgi:hypothetical protein